MSGRSQPQFDNRKMLVFFQQMSERKAVTALQHCSTSGTQPGSSVRLSREPLLESCT